MKNKLLPLFFLFGVWLLFASPYFFQNKIPYPAKYQVSFFTPWNAYPQYAGPIQNNALSDVVDQLYPWKHFTVEELKEGSLPLWNPYSFSGTPHLANYQTAIFSPFNLLFFLLPFIDAWSFTVLLQPLLAGIFMYLFIRTLRISVSGSLVSSISFMFCGFMTVWMAYGTLPMAIAFLPLSLFALEKIFQFKRFSYYTALLALSLTISFFSGHFQTSLYLACYVFAYLLFSFFRTKEKRALLFSLIAFLFGISVSLIQIIPSLQFYHFAVRSELFSNTEGIPWYYLVTVFAPDFFGNPVTRNDWLGHYAEWASYIGIIPLLFATIALFIKKQRGIVLFFFFAGIVSLFLALDTPLQQVMALLKIPVFSTSIPSRIIVLFSFSFAVLSGLGLHFFIEKAHQKSFRKILSFFIPVSVVIFLTWIVVFLSHILPMDKVILAKRNLLLPTVLFIGVFVASTFVYFTKNKYRLLLPIIILLLVTFDSWRFVHKWLPFEDRMFLFPDVPVIQAMQKEVGNGRVYGDFGAYVDTYYRIPSVEGYDPLFSKRYGEFLQTAKTGAYRPAVRSLASLDENGVYTQRVLDILGVNLIYQPVAHSQQSFAFPVWKHPENFPTVYRDDKFAIFKNSTVLPRVKLFSHYEVISDQKKLLERFFSKDFDYRNVLLLEEDPKIESSQEVSTSKTKIVSYEPNKIVISVLADKPSLLFLSDSYYPQWKATVNGKQEKIFIADYTLRAVKVPLGKSTVEFFYDRLF